MARSLVRRVIDCSLGQSKRLKPGSWASRRAAEGGPGSTRSRRQLTLMSWASRRFLLAIQCYLCSSSVKNDFPGVLFFFNFKL